MQFSREKMQVQRADAAALRAAATANFSHARRVDVQAWASADMARAPSKNGA